MKRQGGTAKPISAVMGRAYKETFDNTSEEAKKVGLRFKKTRSMPLSMKGISPFLIRTPHF